MPEKIYWSLFILCVILTQGIVGSSLEQNNEEATEGLTNQKLSGESSNVLIREKRVINRLQGQETSVGTGEAPYIVNIKKYSSLHCVGSILSHRTFITAAECVDDANPLLYKIVSGATYTYRGENHTIADRIYHHYALPRETIMTGIALVTVNPTFEYTHATYKIDLHVGPILPGMDGLIIGWGSYVHGQASETAYPRKLRSINVPIINHRDCVNAYRYILQLGDRFICTYHEHKRCGVTDSGAPLVVNGQLVGIHLGITDVRDVHGCVDKPSIFALLQHLGVNQWIRNNIDH